MSNQNKTTTRKTLLITTMVASMGFVIVANSVEPELTTKDESLESVTTIDTDVTQNLENSKQPEEVLEASSDEPKTTTKDDTENEGKKAVETKEESKCGG